MHRMEPIAENFPTAPKSHGGIVRTTLHIHPNFIRISALGNLFPKKSRMMKIYFDNTC